MRTRPRLSLTRSLMWAQRGSSDVPSSAGRVLVVIAYRDLDGDLHGVNAWPATGADLKIDEEGLNNGQDD